MIIRCLGAVGATHEGEFTPMPPAQQRVIALLTAAGTDGLTTHEFGDELYVNDLPDKWEGAVRMAISRLRRALPVGAIDRSGGRYRLVLDADQVDVWALQRDPAEAPVANDLARTLLSGAPYAGLEPSPLLRTGADEIAAARVRLMRWMSERANSWSAPTLHAADALARSELFRESVFRAAAELLIAAGEGAAAVSLLADGCDYLLHELGVEPSPETRKLLATATERGGTGGPDRTANSAVERSTGATLIGTNPRLGQAWILRPELHGSLVNAATNTGALLIGDPGSGKTLATSAVAGGAGQRSSPRPERLRAVPDG